MEDLEKWVYPFIFLKKNHTSFLNSALTSADGWEVSIAKTKDNWDAFIINIDTSFTSVVLEADPPLLPEIIYK